MLEFRELIPSPSSLITFEAAARLQSFTRAADELGVSQPAIGNPNAPGVAASAQRQV